MFADGKRSADVTLRDQGSATICIEKAAAPTDPKGAMTVYNRSAQTYTVDLNTLLPKLGGSRTYGKLDGSAVTKVELNGDYYHSEAADENKARIEDGKLLLPIQSVDSSAASAIGTITVHVVSQNYKAFDLTIDVSAANKPSSGGFVTPAPVNPDVITVKEAPPAAAAQLRLRRRLMQRSSQSKKTTRIIRMPSRVQKPERRQRPKRPSRIRRPKRPRTSRGRKSPRPQPASPKTSVTNCSIRQFPISPIRSRSL